MKPIIRIMFLFFIFLTFLFIYLLPNTKQLWGQVETAKTNADSSISLPYSGGFRRSYERACQKPGEENKPFFRERRDRRRPAFGGMHFGKFTGYVQNRLCRDAKYTGRLVFIPNKFVLETIHERYYTNVVSAGELHG